MNTKVIVSILRGGVTILFFLVFFLASTNTINAQQVSLSGVEIKKSNEGFIISGKVDASDLNPEGQIVESDYLSVLAEIPLAADYLYPVLWQTMVIRQPADAETSYKKGDNFLTKKELNGQNIDIIKMLNSTAIRKVSVWREYGGLNDWRDNAPEKVETDFEGLIPAEYVGKQIRIRATLKHTFGGPYAAWSAYTFAHDTISITLEKETNNDLIDKQKPNKDKISKSQLTKPVNQVLDKVKDVFNAAIGIFKKKDTRPDMTSFPEPGDSDFDNNSNPEQQEKIKQIIDKVIQNNNQKNPDGNFQTKYWLNQNLLNPFIDKVSSYVPLGKYYKDYLKADKDNQLFSSGEEKIKKTALDYNVDKDSAKYFNKYNKITEIEKKYSPMKNAVPETAATKPFSWLLDKIGWGAKKQYAQSLGKEYKYIRQKIKTYTDKTGMTRDEAIKRVKADYVGFQGDYGNGSFGKVDTGIKWWGSKGKYQDTGARFDDMVKDMVESGQI